jgi:hypothetical protein
MRQMAGLSGLGLFFGLLAAGLIDERFVLLATVELVIVILIMHLGKGGAIK